MSDSILSQVALSYSPMVDRLRAVTATRLTVFPLVPGAPLDAGALLAEIATVWPQGGAQVSLNVLSESLLQDLLVAAPSSNVMIEIPAFMAADENHTEAIKVLHASGNTLLIKGRPLRELPREVLPCFRHSIIALADDRRVGESSSPAGVKRNIGYVQSGVRTIADMEGSFSRGATAVLGWPMDDVFAQEAAKSGDKGKTVGTDLQVIVELIHRVDQHEPIEKLEATLRRDPTLAFKLMRYINSPAFGLSVEISSFRHAIMMLGYNRLKRWLALLLATASKDANLKPVMFAAVRRGMLMEELVRPLGDDEMKGELFICGVFSLLDRMFHQSFAELLKTLPVPERVYQALAENSGPYQPYCALVQAVEGDELQPIREACDSLISGPKEINRALLQALATAAQLD
ncbi:EAL and HDOD domain-containing protein [Methylibium sp.]|uniref:EAL and HDOD domain-containing protein n=1 Tax=Methylibium sp. TaxID=2067992 RepID=UPI00180706CE|nr:HDOD domain-containing protein [Methylibium sp.]MBA3589191.1 HDOD domain-containing protein [Methylibium sp.]